MAFIRHILHEFVIYFFCFCTSEMSSLVKVAKVTRKMNSIILQIIKKALCQILRGYCACAILIISVLSHHVDATLKPHIIFIMADDLGWNDVSFHGSDQIMTPNIDALAYNGIILNNLYTQPVCTPSRAALMTGKYPIHLGMQGPPILAAEPVGLPLSEKTLANYLKELGYKTRAVGKWHLGFYRKEYTPRYRGFDSFYGYYGGFMSYFDHILQDTYPILGDFPGYDLHRNEEAAWKEAEGIYATDLFTREAVKIINEHNADDSPLFLYVAHLAVHAANSAKLLEAPQDEIEKFKHIPDPNRRTYAAMVSKLDESVGEIVEALEEKQMLRDTIIVFMTDNGAPSVRNGTPPLSNYPNWGSNYPLRGAKGTLWEGATKSASFIWSASIQQNPRVSTNLMHVTDWLPTLYTAAGGNPINLPPNLDGVDQWYPLTLNLPSRVRKSILLNIDERNRNAAIRVENWKLIIGLTQNGSYDGYYGKFSDTLPQHQMSYNISDVMDSKSGKAITSTANALFLPWATDYEIKTRRHEATVKCDTSNIWDGNTPNNVFNCQNSPCLFKIDSDPCERNNLSNLYPTIVTQLYEILKMYRGSLVPQINRPVDALRADPKLWNYTWTTWL